MSRYPSNITFLYYKNLSYGTSFMEEVLDLILVMDQGFAKVYQVNQTSFIGIVGLKDSQNITGNTLISLNSNHLKDDFNRIKEHDVINLTEIKAIASIQLHSFFFEDLEGHRFEIQRFDIEEDRQIFEQ